MVPTSGITRGMRGMAFATALAMVALLAVPSATQASVGFEITPFAGFATFDNKTNYKDAVQLGGKLGLYPWPFLGIEGNVGYSPTKFDSMMVLPDPYATSVSGDVRHWNFMGDIVWRILPDKWVVPFIYGGLGQVRAYVKDTDIQEYQLGYEFGGGLLFRINENVGIRLEAKDLMYQSDFIASDDLLHNIIATGGFTIGFGGAFPDQDMDGVPDNRDRCPDTPLGALVDKDGCPIDSDGDGVPDGIDQCPNTPTGAVVDAQGCPIDSDGDGVPDGLDLCPNTPAGAKVDKDGCPIEISELETLFLDTGLITLQDINFETNKANILPESYPRLDEVGSILVQWPQLRIEIGGHADSRGAADYNQKLSERRANSVLEYLVEKFPAINKDQYTVKGYGESVPLVPNDGPENWAKNRRVEFKVQNTDVLQKEVERRRLLRQDEGGAPEEEE